MLPSLLAQDIQTGLKQFLVAAFARANREEDYQVAWAFFENNA